MSPTNNALAKYRLRPSKRLGQNFLIDDALLDRLARIACENSTLPVLEIGAGNGNFSAHLARYAPALTVVEKDRALEPALREALAAFPKTEIIIDDFLNIDLGKRTAGEKLKIVGNLPFYITIPIISRLIEQRKYLDSVFIMVQKEVAERIIAQPASKSYGRLTCLVQFYTTASLHCTISPAKFFPMPKVDAGFVELKILKKPAIEIKSEKIFFALVKALFAYRRKTLLNSILAGGGLGLTKEQLLRILNTVRISPVTRGEQLSLNEIGRMADEIHTFLA